MNNEFQEKVRDNLKGLNKKQYVFFAWLCAVRALPFIGIKGNFNFWKEDKRQKHLFSVINALDISYFNGVDDYAAAAATDVAGDDNVFYNLIFEDIEHIISNSRDSLNISISIYGEVWDNFQKALIKEGCGYWAKLYENIFKSGFKQDIEELKRRLSVPKEIQEQGAL